MNAWDYIEEHQELIKAGDAIVTMWTVDDVQDVASDMTRELTYEECKNVLAYVHKNFDAEQGINYVAIYNAIHDLYVAQVV